MVVLAVGWRLDVRLALSQKCRPRGKLEPHGRGSGPERATALGRSGWNSVSQRDWMEDVRQKFGIIVSTELGKNLDGAYLGGKLS